MAGGVRGVVHGIGIARSIVWHRECKERCVAEVVQEVVCGKGSVTSRADQLLRKTTPLDSFHPSGAWKEVCEVEIGICAGKGEWHWAGIRSASRGARHLQCEDCRGGSVYTGVQEMI